MGDHSTTLPPLTTLPVHAATHWSRHRVWNEDNRNEDDHESHVHDDEDDCPGGPCAIHDDNDVRTGHSRRHWWWPSRPITSLTIHTGSTRMVSGAAESSSPLITPEIMVSLNDSNSVGSSQLSSGDEEAATNHERRAMVPGSRASTAEHHGSFVSSRSSTVCPSASRDCHGRQCHYNVDDDDQNDHDNLTPLDYRLDPEAAWDHHQDRIPTDDTAPPRRDASSPRTMGVKRIPHPPNDAIRFRSIEPRDRQVIQQLHEQWFPVSYVNEFYDDLVQQRLSHHGSPTALYTQVAVTQQRPVNDRETGDETHEQIVACLVGSFVHANALSDESRKLLVTNGNRFPRLFYIMTLGTISDYRQSGLASQLVRQCTNDVVDRDTGCGIMYLHVLPTNQAAIRFYEKLRFRRVSEIMDYYTIQGQPHNAYLYAKYYHGNTAPCDLVNLWNRTLSLVWGQLIHRPLSMLASHTRFMLALTSRLLDKEEEEIDDADNLTIRPLSTASNRHPPSTHLDLNE